MFYLSQLTFAISLFNTKVGKKNRIVTTSHFLFVVHFLWLNSMTAAPKTRMKIDLSTALLGCIHECPSKETLTPTANAACGPQTKIGDCIHGSTPTSTRSLCAVHKTDLKRSIFFYYLYCMLSHIIINKEKKIGPLLQREGQVVFIKVAAGIWEGK